MSPKVSIIVPIYNVEKYLSACLDSLINQTLKDIEIICVNDCSPDSSNIVLQQYAEKDNRIKIVNHKENQGLGAARNTGVNVASAKYVGFIDSDDYVSTDMFELLYYAMLYGNVQVAMCGISKVSDDGLVITTGEYLKKGKFSVLEVLTNASLYEALLPAWNKLYIRDIIKDIKQLPIVSEDQPFLGELFSQIDRVSIVSKPCYYYRNREGTLSKPKEHTPKNWDDFFYAHRLFFLALKHKFSDKELRLQSLRRSFSVLWRIKRFNLLNNPNWTEQENCIREHIKSDDFELKSNSKVVYYILLFIVFRKKISIYSKKKRINRGMQLIQLCATNPWSQSKDILFVIKMVRILSQQFLFSISDKFEILFYKKLASTFKLFVQKKIWLIGERVDTMQDNGFAFFKYLQNTATDKKVYYISSTSQSTCIPKKNTLKYNSFYHKLLFCASKVYANSHYNAGYPRTRFSSKIYQKPLNCLNVFLQHGITNADVSPYYGKQSSDIDLFVCGAKPEYDYVVEKFGFNKEQVLLTGFPRFDNLHHNNTLKKQMLFMPTWRRTLSNLSLEAFQETEYYMRIDQFLNAPELSLLLEKYNYTLIFQPHYEMKSFLSVFKTTNKRITIAEDGTEIQQLLKESKLLITDVSSVHFDFAYMKKPIVYYCWDYPQLIATHLGRGYYSHHKMGFGPVVGNHEELINALTSMMENNAKMNDLYLDRVNIFFPLMDNKNCKRLYNHINKIVK
ncbi:CDP-glycerol glycerophosphotransferase family protein [Bacteroides sp.]|uniref:bifunctional glycosyltransferase/CDP-glycerol:glycerophosphate glycerophosphotransferase n=1 Tax=Bacteroides sp. TaxID=29523 RepID=UPI0026179DDF|nr:CDP-glycerol glycerophosphotransferase family protein [Bacteroides sp.]MDD3038761.1 CDP-glycerol glycerophosphotransferase family protein [Bacteroides sp.]